MTIEQCMIFEKKRLEINKKHMENGVEFKDITTAYIDENVKIEKGTLIENNVTIKGKSEIGTNCIIGSNSEIDNSVIGNNNTIKNSVINQSIIGDDNNIGPFAYLRPNTKICNNCKIGDFVEVKNSVVGDGSKASHLTYIGDSDIGANVNLGCGVVFVNYDGKNKHRSVVGDNSFVGCNTNIISPIEIEGKSYIAAGSTVTKNVPKDSLYVSRSKERIIKGWVSKRGLIK